MQHFALAKSTIEKAKWRIAKNQWIEKFAIAAYFGNLCVSGNKLNALKFMGINTISLLPAKTNKMQVVEFLQILGFEKITPSHLQYYNENNLEQVTPIIADVIRKKENLVVEITTTVWRSIFDHDIHNFTLKQLKLRFNGSFHTNKGLNRYLIYDDYPRRKSEAACYLAYFHFSNNLSRIDYYLSTLKTHFLGLTISDKDYYHPASTHTTIGLPFLISILEDYLRSIYIGLLTYSEKKKDIFKSSKISSELLYDVTLNETTIEKVIAHSKSFQNIAQINANFKEIDTNINFIDLLNRTQPKKRYLEQLTQIITLRHKIIHEAIKVENYSTDHFQFHIQLISDISNIFYSKLQELYKWQDTNL